MIRRDYILRMIEEFLQLLARLKSLKQEHRWEEAAGTLDEQFHRLVGAGTAGNPRGQPAGKHPAG